MTFEQVLDELRHKLALDYLGVNKASVKQTARLRGLFRSVSLLARVQAMDGIQSARVCVARCRAYISAERSGDGFAQVADTNASIAAAISRKSLFN